jgi:hypothetical protein
MSIDITGILCMKWSTFLLFIETLSNLITDEIISLVRGKVGCYFSLPIKNK